MSMGPEIGIFQDLSKQWQVLDHPRVLSGSNPFLGDSVTVREAEIADVNGEYVSHFVEDEWRKITGCYS